MAPFLEVNAVLLIPFHFRTGHPDGFSDSACFLLSMCLGFETFLDTRLV